MQLVRWAIVLCGLVGLVGLVGCYDPSLRAGAPCHSVDECPAAQYCVAGRCSLSAAQPIDAPPPPPPDAPPPDAPPPDAHPVCSTVGLTCPGGVAPTMFECGNHCWTLCTGLATRTAAAAACAAWTGALGQIDDATENACVAAKNQGAIRTWIGLVQDNAATTASMNWTWNGVGLLNNFVHWAALEPEDGGGGEADHAEQCGSMEADGTWDDQGCAATNPFFCERP
jgi:hypothetical protein